MKTLPRAVIVLGAASFFTDVSSEMIYPLLPLFVAGVLGAGPLALGAIEGVAEATASLLKVASGLVTDRTGRRKPLVVAGYGLAGACRPLIGLAGGWPAVLLLRFLDRVGKGLRTSPRDAWIADAASPELRGTAYGFHRAMDHAGSVAGPFLAAGLLAMGVSLREVFLLAAVPAAVVLVLLLPLREPGRAPRKPPDAPLRPRSRLVLDRSLRTFLLAVLIFNLGKATDAFLLLRLTGGGLPAGGLAALWALHHVVKCAAAALGGRLSDRVERRWMLLAGWLLHALVYAAFAAGGPPAFLVGAFLVYGVHFGLVEPAERALVADLAPGGRRGTAFGLFHFTVGIAALPASLLFGSLWEAWGPGPAFSAGTGLTLLSMPVLLALRGPSLRPLMPERSTP